jgi:hypothetical protein
MPNWCDNTVSIFGSKEVLESVIEFVKPNASNMAVLDEAEPSAMSLQSIFPMDTELLNGSAFTSDSTGWYDWRVENWGTKWDIKATSSEIFSFSEGIYAVDYNFDSAWAPPTEVFVVLSKTFPEIVIHLSYDEPGMDFSGYAVISQGEIVDEEQFNNSYDNMSIWLDSSRCMEYTDLDINEIINGKVE